MTELIKVTEQADGRQAVSARELHEFLEVPTRFDTWVKRMIETYGFEENIDYVTTLQKNGIDVTKNEHVNYSSQQLSRAGISTEYIISLDMAKELSMVQRTERGKQARQYFIACEKKLRDVMTHPKTYIEALEAFLESEKQKEQLRVEAEQLSVALVEAKPKLEYYDVILNSVDTMTIKQIAEDYGLSANTLNRILHDARIQYKEGKTWYLYSEHKGTGLTESKTYDYFRIDGSTGSKVHMTWTQKGRLLIHKVLTDLGHVANYDKEMR